MFLSFIANDTCEDDGNVPNWFEIFKFTIPLKKFVSFFRSEILN